MANNRFLKSNLIVSLVFLFLLTSCGGSKKAVHEHRKAEKNVVSSLPETEETDPRIEALPDPEENPPAFKSDIDRYIYTYKGIAKEEMRTYGIPASITLAQGLLESDAGKGKLTRKSNNHFGIKCHGWKGEKVYHDDDIRQECFRKYKNPEYSFRDHSLFLKNRRRYSALFKLKEDDYSGWARGLKSAGYATDPAYPRKLISIIERYELYKYDDQVLGKRSVQNDETLTSENSGNNAQVHFYIVKKDDTLYSIGRRFGIPVEELKKQNYLNSNLIFIGQRLRIDGY